MRLLVFTQKVDKEDSVLGFFHNWLEKLAPKFESINVICLQKGDSNLPSNVEVFSLGKEKGVSKISYVLSFYKNIFKLWSQYDAVFVHMNQEYILLGGLFWKFFGKRVYLWRNHKDGSFLTKIAVWFSNKVFYTSPKSFTAQFAKSMQMPVGIDTEIFKSKNLNPNTKIKNSILSLGRISPIKNVHLIVEVAQKLKEKGIKFKLDIVGDPANSEDFKYKSVLERENAELVNEGLVSFIPAIPNYEAPLLYQSHEVFINLTPPGSFDKTILEAAACGCVPFVSMQIGKDFAGVYMPDLNPTKIALRLEAWFNTDEMRKDEICKELEHFVFEKHSLDSLVKELATQIK